MSILHVTQIAKKISDLFSNHLDQSDLNQNDPEFDTKLLTRCLAAYAVYNHLGCSEQEAAQSVVDGGDDNGIDAIYYSPSLKEVVIVQSKWIKSGSGEPESGDIGKFCRGVEDLLNLNFDRFNKKVRSLQSTIVSAISNFETRYVLIVIYTGDKGLAIHAQQLIDDLVENLNDAGEGVTESLVSFKKLDQPKIYSSLSKGLVSDPINFNVGIYQWGKVTEPFGAYYGFISGEEIAKLWQDYGRRLFDKNIRNVLGTTEVNDELVATIRDNPDRFWYYNNGVTIIAETIEKSMIGGSKRELGNFKLSGASVVNGAQTVSTIGKVIDLYKDNLKKVYVHAKIVSLENAHPEFGNEITKANNRQNRIENRDFVSQDPQQTRLKHELAHDEITYNIVRSDSFVSSDKSFEVEEATISLACASRNVSLAVQAKREIGKFYENLTKGIYKQIFNASISSRYLLNSVMFNREIEKAIAQKVSALSRKGGKEFGILVHGNRIISLLVFNRINIEKDEVMEINSTLINQLVDENFQKIREAIREVYPDNVLGTLFKGSILRTV